MSIPERTIRTARLTLRPFLESDVDALFDLFSRPEVARWSGDGRAMTVRDEAVQRLRKLPERAGHDPVTAILGVIQDGYDRPMGMVLLVPIPASSGSEREDLELGWHLHPDVWGRGYATEAASAMIEHASESGIEQLIAVTDPDNSRSQAVCRRLGMTDLGLRDDWYDRSLHAFVLELDALVA